jgi:ATP-dependent protease HslVU (ClpYQ) peptidase subunit
MTVISAALTKKDGIVIVGDSSVTGGFSKDEDGYNKLWVEKENGQFIFGGCGGVRPMQVIKHWISWPYYRDGMNLEEFAVKEVVPLIRDALKDHGALLIDEETSLESFDGAFVMAWSNNLVVIDEDFSVMIPHSNRAAIGSGMSEAMGSLGNKGPWTKGQVINSVKKSAATAIGVGGPLWVATTNSMSVVLVEP